MNPITPTAATSFQTGPQAQGTEDASDAKATPSSLSATSASEESSTQTEEPEFSTRAERLAALNEEFNIMGPDFKLSTTFIQRLHELDFIDESEAEQLIGRMPDAPAVGTDSGTAVQSLQASLAELAEEKGSESSLFDLLNQAADALGNLSAKSRADLEGLTQQLEQALSDQADLGEADAALLGQARDVMMIASRLAPGSGVNAAIESYLAHAR